MERDANMASTRARRADQHLESLLIATRRGRRIGAEDRRELHVCPQCGSRLRLADSTGRRRSEEHWAVDAALPRLRVARQRRLRPGDRRPLRRGARRRHRGRDRRPRSLERANMEEEIEPLRRRARARPDPARGLLASLSLRSSARRRRRRPARAAALSSSESPRLGERRFAVGDRDPAPARATASSAPVAAIRSQSAAAAPGVEVAQVELARARGRLARARISGRVTVPSSRSVPRALPVRSGGPVTSSTSSSSWKASPISAPNARRAPPRSAPASARAGRRTRTGRGLQPAALEVALAR